MKSRYVRYTAAAKVALEDFNRVTADPNADGWDRFDATLVTRSAAVVNRGNREVQTLQRRLGGASQEGGEAARGSEARLRESVTAVTGVTSSEARATVPRGP